MRLDAKPVDVKPVDVKPVDAKPVDAKPVDVKPGVMAGATRRGDGAGDTFTIPVYFLQASMIELRFAMSMAACCNMTVHVQDGVTLGDDWVVVSWDEGGMSTLCAECAYGILARPKDFKILFGPGVRAEEPEALPEIADDLVQAWMENLARMEGEPR